MGIGDGSEMDDDIPSRVSVDCIQTLLETVLTRHENWSLA